MGALFGKTRKKQPQSPHISDKDRAILELKRQRDRLKKYTHRLTGVITRETSIARDLLRGGRKDRALLALKKKKYQESLLEKTEGQLFNIEEMVNSIEFASLQSSVFKALESGNVVLKAINSEISLDDVEKLMDDTAEAIEYQHQMSMLLGGALTEEDNDAVDEEYAALEAMMADEEKLAMPSVPATKPTTVTADDETITIAADDEEEEEEEEVEEVSKPTKEPVVLMSV